MSFISRFSPIPGFPPFSGPYDTGSFHLEIPVSLLDSPAPSPDDSLSTVSFRVFYPCESSSRQPPIKWLTYPTPKYIQAYAKFVGANNLFAQLFSYFPHLLYYTTIPVRNNAQPLPSTSQSQRWPVMLFSHGLGGSMHAYSFLCGSLASHGMVVIAPEHRDGSTPVSYITSPTSGKLKPLYYRRVSHTASPEVYEARDQQLRIRLWELGLIYDAILKIDTGLLSVPNSAKMTNRETGELTDVLRSLRGQLDVHTPGSIALAGHSFGAATMVQFAKSVYYNLQSHDPSYQALFTPTPGSSITQQITPSNPVILLDMFCLPLRSPSTAWLHSQPMPCFHQAAGGNTVLSILSETFFKWRGNLSDMKTALAEDPTGSIKSSSSNYSMEASKQYSELDDEHDGNSLKRTKPSVRWFYPIASAHLSQSDFGILFPRVTKLAFKSEDPERLLKLNVRAILQSLRECGYQIASTAQIDLEEDEKNFPSEQVPLTPTDAKGDWRILATNGAIKGWVPINFDEGTESESDESSNSDKWKTRSDAVVEGEVLGEVVG